MSVSSDLAGLILQATPAELSNILKVYDPMTWAVETARIVLPKEGSLDFKLHRFMIDVYRDTCPEIVILKGAQLGFAVDDETEVLSRRGWLRYDQIIEGEDILTFDTATETTRWSPVERLWVYPRYAGPMIHLEGRNIDALVTPNHRWAVKHHSNPYGYRFRETGDLKGSDTIPIRAQHADFPVYPVFTDAFVELAGWVITDGTYDRGSSRIVVAQNLGINAARIRDVMRRNGIESHEHLMAGDRCLTFAFAGPVAAELRAIFPDKELTADFVASLTKHQCELLFDAMMTGDGSWQTPSHRDTETTPMFFQRTAARGTIDAFMMLAFLLGHRPKEVVREARDTPFPGNLSGHIRQNGPQSAIHVGRVDRRVHIAKINRTEVPYRGLVWCLTTRDGTFVMRRGGKVAITGNSTWAIVRVLWMLLTFPCTVIYSFPTRDQVTEYTASRINPIIQGSAYVMDRILDVDSVRTKQFSRLTRAQRTIAGPGTGVSTIHFNGAQNEKDPTTTDADLLVHDEEDRSNAQVIQQYGSRLDHSSYKWRIRLSTPTRPQFGVHKGYMDSDRRHWLVRCHACRAEFELTWPLNVEPKTWLEVQAGHEPRFACHLCGATITDEDRINGRWVAEFTTQGLPHGYQMSQLAAPWVSAYRILQKFNDADFEGDFFNLVLGLPYLAGDELMERERVLKRQGEHRMMSVGSGCFMGIDVGRSIDIVVDDIDPSGRPRTIWMGSVKEFEEIDVLIGAYSCLSVVIDALPEEREVKDLQRRWNSNGITMIWRAIYREPAAQSAQREILWRNKEDQVTPVVSAPRDELLSGSSNELLTRRVLPRFHGEPAYEAYLRHHENSKRAPEWDTGKPREGAPDRYVWVNDGADHFFHAATYAMLARMAPRDIAPPLERGLIGVSTQRRTLDKMASPDRPPGIRVQRWG